MPSATTLERYLPPLLFYLSLLVLLVGFWLRLTELPAYPIGISFDESTKLIDGLRLAQSGNYPFYEDLGRPEPLWRFFYAFSTTFFGTEVWLNRLTYFFVGIVTLALTYWATRQILHDAPPLIRTLAGIVALLTLTFALGHITLSRSYYRAMLQIPPMLITLGFLARGLHTYHRRDFVYAGIALGIIFYTYTGGYIAPFALLPMGLSLLILRWGTWRKWLPALILMSVIALLVMSPMLIRLMQNPSAVLARVDDVNRADSIPLDAYLVQRVLSQILVAGDQNPQYNVATAPMMPVQLTALFWLGLAGLLIRLRQPMSIFVIAWLVLMPFPAILSGELPHGIRSAGLFAVLPVIAGVGIASLLILLRRVIAVRYSVVIGALIVAVWLGFAPSIAGTYKDYWRNADQWRQWQVHGLTLTHNEWFFRTDRRALAKWMLLQDTPMLVPLAEFNGGTTQAWLFSRYPRIQSATPELTIPPHTLIVLPYDLGWADFFISPQFVLLDGDAMTILPPFDAQTRLAFAQEQGDFITNEGNIPIVGKAFALTDAPRWMPRQPTMPYILDGDLQIMGWYGDDTLTGTAGRYQVGLEWLPLRRLGHDYIIYVQVQTQDYERIAGIDQRSLRWLYPTFQWQAESPIVDTYAFNLPDLPMGAYRLTVGMYPNFGERVPVTLADEFIGTQATVAWLKVPPVEPVTLPDERLIPAPLIADSLTLEAVSISQADDTYEIALTWQSQIERPNFDATIFIHALDADGNIITQEDTRPLSGQYPTFIWSADEVVQTTHRLILPDDTSPAEIRLRVGMYSFTPDPQNLSITRGDIPQPDNVIMLGTLEDWLP